MVTLTAQDILDENNYTEAEISKLKVEAFIDNAINYINLNTGLAISNMSGTAGSKTVTLTNKQAPVVKALASLYVRAYVDHGPQVSVSGLSSSIVDSDPQLSLLREVYEQGVKVLCGRGFERTRNV